MLTHYRTALAMRRANPPLVSGDMQMLPAQGDVARFVRKLGDKSIFCGFNLSDQPATCTLPDGDWISFGACFGGTTAHAQVDLPAWGLCLAKQG
jgi:alpha-glucosidase